METGFNDLIEAQDYLKRNSFDLDPSSGKYTHRRGVHAKIKPQKPGKTVIVEYSVSKRVLGGAEKTN